MIRKLAAVLATLAIFGIGCWAAFALWKYYMYSPWTRDARIRANVVTIAPDVAGFVTSLNVIDNQRVNKGDVLFVIDQERYRLTLASAKATMTSRKAEMLMQQSNAVRRTKMTNWVSKEETENAQHTASSAAGAYQQAVADESRAELDLERTTVRAPVNGFVTNLTLVVGQYAAVGTKVMAIIDSDSYRVEGYFEETKIPLIKLNDLAEIRLMSGGPALRGHVESISYGITDRDNASGPELLADVNPTFEWVRLAQRIPVRIHIDEVPVNVHISAGMTCTVVLSGPPPDQAN